jgi:hypothetical protein
MDSSSKLRATTLRTIAEIQTFILLAISYIKLLSRPKCDIDLSPCTVKLATSEQSGPRLQCMKCYGIGVLSKTRTERSERTATSLNLLSAVAKLSIAGGTQLRSRIVPNGTVCARMTDISSWIGLHNPCILSA